ncbi:Uncharacterized protein Fot_32252 [Forsythia ovata]|uniref:Uncharacterized protein n=1 Tax=Forsythia ovata TaxID=205694 RepID=A0ABD1T7A3_9LAMI
MEEELCVSKSEVSTPNKTSAKRSNPLIVEDGGSSKDILDGDPTIQMSSNKMRKIVYDILPKLQEQDFTDTTYVLVSNVFSILTLLNSGINYRNQTNYLKGAEVKAARGAQPLEK